MEQVKVKWKKLGSQYQAYMPSSPKDILSIISVQARAFNDARASYEVEPMNDISFKKFNKISDAKKYAESVINHLIMDK